MLVGLVRPGCLGADDRCLKGVAEKPLLFGAGCHCGHSNALKQVGDELQKGKFN